MISNKFLYRSLHHLYPETDGKPIAENTLQFEWIVLIKLGLEACFVHDPNIFIAGDLFWYPVEGNNKIRLAPDVLVALGRPKGHRGSYLQWMEDNIPPQIVFEVLSPGNRAAEMQRKFAFYETYGVKEYYIFDPDRKRFSAYLRQGDQLLPVEKERLHDFVSPLLQVRFVWHKEDFHLYEPSGKRFLSYLELVEAQEKAWERLDENKKQLAGLKNQLKESAAVAEQESKRADFEAQRAEQEAQRAEQETLKARKLAARLKELGIDPDAI
ncbi:MAG TPA: Uma2 family endonuclease [Saprospiraceae bacterium]|nr:Uma2 family endonuclease [Saprospiraceae bacterium]HMQ83813.1 Uma2 family endonuclease [Saprospiraceae bacterium]